jgi:hypothetical protein
MPSLHSWKLGPGAESVYFRRLDAQDYWHLDMFKDCKIYFHFDTLALFQLRRKALHSF